MVTILSTFRLKEPVTVMDLVIPAKPGATLANVQIMRTLPQVSSTEGSEANLQVKDGYIACDPEQDC